MTTTEKTQVEITELEAGSTELYEIDPYKRSTGTPAKEDGERETEWTAPPRCECGCECGRLSTTKIDGVNLCAECADFYLGPDDEPVCSRVQDRKTCRHCGKRIVWSVIQTRQGRANWRDGHCACRDWVEEERGSAWELSEGEEWPTVRLRDYSKFERAGKDQGQIVSVSYAWADGDLIRRTEDTSERPGSTDRICYSVARDAMDGPCGDEDAMVDDWAALSGGLAWESCRVVEFEE